MDCILKAYDNAGSIYQGFLSEMLSVIQLKNNSVPCAKILLKNRIIFCNSNCIVLKKMGYSYFYCHLNMVVGWCTPLIFGVRVSGALAPGNLPKQTDLGENVKLRGTQRFQ